MISIQAAADSSTNDDVEESNVEILPVESTASALPTDATTFLPIPEKVDQATNTEYTVGNLLLFLNRLLNIIYF